MKKRNFAIVFLMLTAAFISVAFIARPPQSQIEMPDNIEKIVEKSCFGCHNTDSQNEDAKEALDFKTMDELRKVKKITTLREIAETVEKGEMPPKRFLENYPDRKPSKDEAAALVDWAKKESKKLIGN